MDIHQYEDRYRACLKRVEKANISDRNKQLILELNDALVLENLSRPRLMKYLEVMKLLAQRLNKDLDKATEIDLKKLVSEIQQSNFSAWTKQTYKVILRRFYKWLYKTKNCPEIVSWINIRMSRSEKKLPSEGDLLVEKDIEMMITTATHPRDKALVAVLWESGARIGEIGNLCLKNVNFDKYGVVLTVKGKTGSRSIRLIWGVSYLSTWLNNHPFKDDKNSPLWLNIGNIRHKKVMSYSALRFILINLAQEAGIKKRINPHTFRHSRATYMAHFLTEFQMNQYFGWIQGSDMPSTYVHMSGKAVDDAILAMNGIKAEAKKDEVKLVPKICPRCDTINAQDSKHCNKCGGIMDLKYAMELEQEAEKRKDSDRIMDLLLKDKDVQSLLMEKLKGIGLQS